MKDEYSIEKSRSLKSCKATLQKNKNCNKNQEISNFLFTDRNKDIVIEEKIQRSNRYSEGDDQVYFLDFVDSEVRSDYSDDDQMPQLLVITRTECYLKSKKSDN